VTLISSLSLLQKSFLARFGILNRLASYFTYLQRPFSAADRVAGLRLDRVSELGMDNADKISTELSGVQKLQLKISKILY
jgi:hypothetical protein